MSPDQRMRYWRRRTFGTLWVTYGSLYLCRLNMPVVVPAIMAGLGYTKAQMGQVMSALYLTYAAGQFVNGQLGDRFGARVFVPIGMLVSAALNVVFGFLSGLTAMTIVWAANGYFQSMGWGPTVKTLANWFPPRLRGKVAGLFGSSYQCGNVGTWLVAGWLGVRFGWRWAFWVPAGLLAASAVHSIWRIRNAPEDVGLPSIEALEKHPGHAREPGSAEPVAGDNHLGFAFTLGRTVANPRVWIASLATCFLSMVTYGLLSWAPTYMNEAHAMGLGEAAVTSMILPLAGAAGMLATGWLLDHFFGGRRAPVLALESLLLSAMLVVMFVWPGIPFDQVSAGLRKVLLAAALAVSGFLLFGAHGMLVSVVAMDFGSRKAAASAAGFMDAMGYVGATVSAMLTGRLAERYGWSTGFAVWAGAALASALLLALLWRYRPSRSAHL